jgi:hypothetical protein
LGSENAQQLVIITPAIMPEYFREPAEVIEADPVVNLTAPR